jgi:protein tyrosine phosphatase
MWSDANLIQLSLKTSIHYLAFTDHCREDVDRFSQIVTAKHVAERVIIQFLKRRETE